MFKNSAAPAFASKKIASSKWLLLLCAASAAAVDIVIIAMLFAGGEGGEYLACPFILLIFDVIYFIVSLFFTNFRFKYSLGVWISYIILYTVGFSIGNAIILGGSGTVLTNGAIALWESVHGFNILCAIICALFASHIIKKLWIALAFAVLFLAGVATYAGYMFTDGFFGQGTGSRTLVYSYDNSTEAYLVTDVLAGRSKTVTVPETFNGKPVTKVNLKVFADSGINTYNLPENIEFGDDKDALNRSLDLSRKRINVDKKSVNDIREKFLDNAVQGYVNVRQNALALANATLPANLAENEGYVAFNYDMTDFDAAHQNTIPVYVGDLKSFDFAAYTAGYDYVKYRDDGSAKNLYWAYVNGGYILNDIADGGFEKSKVVEMNFEKVYRIRVDGGNDAKYDMREKQPELCYDNVGGTNEYKYLTKSMSKTFLNGLTPRNGFTYRWQSGNENITDLSEVIEDGMTLSVQWTLKKPTVTVRTSAPDNTITYGENVTFIPEIQLEADVSLSYLWYDYDKGVRPETARELTLVAPKVAASGNYTLGVTAGGDENTSLTASAVCNFDLKIERKPVTFNWQLPDGRVYDGNMKSVSVSLDEGQQVAGNPIDYTLSGLSSFKDAGTYSFSIVTNVMISFDYEITNPENSVTIAPRPVEVSWANFTDLTYNGATQSPTATATGVSSDGGLPVSVSGGSRNAGNFTARASISNSNYTVSNPSQSYTIKKAPLTVTPDPVTFIYGTTPVSEPRVEYVGFVGGDTSSVLGGRLTAVYAGTNAGTYPAADNGVRVSGYTSSNYDITYLSADLIIQPREVQLSWSGTQNLTYNGLSKNVTATVTNKVGSDDISVLVSGGTETDAGDFTATAYELSGAAKGNYALSEAQYLYTIAKARLTIRPADKKSEYGEELVPLTATVGTMYNNDEIGYELVKEEGENAGTYAITVNITKENPNYEVIAGSGTYTITKRVAYVLWLTESQRTHIYDGTEYDVFTDSAYSYRGFLEKDIPYVMVTGYKATDAGDYVARVNLDSGIAGNYTLASPECEWKIEKTLVLFGGYINGEQQTENELKAVVGDVFTWSFANSQGRNLNVQCQITVKYGDAASVVTVSGDRYTFADAGEYEITITSNDKNCIASTKTWKVTVDLVPSEITYDTVFKGSLVKNVSKFTTQTGDTLRWQCNNTEGEFKAYYTYRALNAAGADDAIRYVDGDSFMFSYAGVYDFTFTVAETSVYGAKTVSLQVTVNEN